MRNGARTLLAPLAAACALACSGGGGGEGGGGPPALALSATSLSFAAVEAGGDPAAQSLTVSNGGGGALAAPTTAVTYATGTGWLAAEVAGERAPFTVTVRAAAGSLPAGTYSATVFVRSNGAANTPQAVAVSLVVAPAVRGPRLGLSTTALSFGGRSHGEAPPSQSVTIGNAGDGTLARPAARIAYEGGAGGWLSASVAGDAAPFTLTVAAATGGLPAGTHRATVSLESAGATNSPAAIAVTLTLTPTWTVLVYASADNALSSSLLSALAEMSEATIGDGVTVLVAADWSAGRALPGGQPLEPGTEWLRIRGGGLPPERLARWEEQDFGDPAVFAAAVEGAFYAYPADRHAVVLWGPGAGWAGFGADEADTPDDPADDGSPLQAAAIAQALEAVLPPLGVPLPLDVIGFDAPLMMSQEVAFALRDVAVTFLATAGLDLGPGWDWAGTLGRLSADPYLTATGFALAEVAAWDARHAGPADLLARAHAALDLGRMDAYAAAFAALSGAMVSTGPDWLAVARDQHGAWPGYGAEPGSAAEAQPRLRDAGQLLDALSARTSDGPVADAAVQARSALDELVLASALGEARRARAQAGVAMEAPLGSRWASSAPAYGGVEWAAATGWADVLTSLALNDDEAEPTFERVVENATAPTYQRPPTIHAVSYDPDVAAARLTLADVASGSGYGVVAEGALEPNAWGALVWDGDLAALDDGATSAFVSLRPWMRLPSGAVWLVPGWISDGAGSVEAQLVVVEGEPAVDRVVVQVEGATGVLALADFRGLSFVPALEAGAAGWSAGATLAIPDSPAASLGFRRTSAPAGTYQLVTTVSDVWGRSSSAADEVVVAEPFGS